MTAYIARRLVLSAFTVFVISILIELPEGDSATKHIDRLMSSGVGASEEQAEHIRVYLGLDKPIYQRYVQWMWNLVRGDFGRSFQFFCSSWATERTVKEIVGDRI